MSGTSVTVKRAWGIETQGGQKDPFGALYEQHNAVVTDLDTLAGLMGDGLLQIGTLAVSAGDASDFKTTTTIYFRKNGIQYSKAATDSLAFASAYTINTGTATGSFWGAFLVEATAADTPVITAKASAADQVYTSEAAAVAALPDATAGSIAIGYITVNANDDTDWVANTDDMTDASDCATADFYDADVLGTATAAASVTAAQVLTTEVGD